MPRVPHESESLTEAKVRMDIVGPRRYHARASLDDYTDIRAGLPGYKEVPCKECDNTLYATVDFRPDDWWCRECLPERLDMSHLWDYATVRL